MNRKRFFLKLVLWLLLFFLLAAAAYGSFFIWKIQQVENKINIQEDNGSSVLETLRNLASDDNSNLKINDDRINILLLGIAGEGKPGRNLTDTVMIASLNTKTNQVGLLSLPRDLYAEVVDADGEKTNFHSKINTIYQYGLGRYPQDEAKAVEPIRKTIEDITSLPIEYWIILNFDGFQTAIDAIGGINIINEKDIYDTSYPGPNYSYETFELKKGFHHLDGATALKYARMRHDNEGDFGRAKRQQQVLQAAKNKIFSTGTLLNVVAVNKLLDTLGDNIKTNINPEELGSFLNLTTKLDTNNISNVVVDAWKSQSLLRVSHVFYNEFRAFVLIPRIGNWSEVQETAQNIFDVNEIKRKREEISKENAKVVIIDKSSNKLALERIKKLLKESFEYKNVVVLSGKNNGREGSSIIYDLTKGEKPFTLNELAKKLPAQISYETPNDYLDLAGNIETDLMVVVGKDLGERYNMIEHSIEDYNKSSETNEYTEFRTTD